MVKKVILNRVIAILDKELAYSRKLGRQADVYALSKVRTLIIITFDLKIPAQTAIDAQLILDQVCDAHELTLEDLLGKSRKSECTQARFHAMYRLRHETVQGKQSYSWIGKQLGNITPGTVCYGVKRWKQQKKALGIS